MGIVYMKSLKLILLVFILSFAVSCGQQKKFIEYTVKDGETMRKIARKLDMKTRDLLRLNPGVARRPDANTVIVIPNKKFVKKETNNIIVDTTSVLIKKDTIAVLVPTFLTHTVVKGDTFYNLTRFYNVTKETLLKLNPELIEGLKLGQTIKIKEQEVEIEDEVELVYKDSISENITLKVALLLPFRTAYYDTISSKDIFKKKNKLVNIVTDFYLGAEIAIDSLQKQGVHIELNVFDTGKKNTKIRSIVVENNLNENDVIIGPLYADEAKFVANKVNKPVVFPVYSKSQSRFSSSKLIKTTPNISEFREKLIGHLSRNYAGENIILVSDGTYEANRNRAIIKTALIAHDSIKEVHQLSPKEGYIKKELFLEILKPLVKNWIVLITDNSVVAADAINSFRGLPEETTVKVFAIKKGNIYEGIDNNVLAQIEFTYVSDTFSEESSLAMKLFNKQYRLKNNTFPSYYATKGFDITYDVLVRLASGDQLKNTFKNGASYRLESKFNYSNELFKATDNNGLFIVKYNTDLSLTKLE